MSPTGSTDDRITLDAIDRWKITAAAGIDDIEGWRDSADSRPEWGDNRARGWGELNDRFYTDTTYLLGIVESHYPRLDAKPLQTVYDIVARWHESRDAKKAKLGRQGTLRHALDLAMQTLNAVQNDVLTRIGAVRDADKVSLNAWKTKILQILFESQSFDRESRMTHREIIEKITSEILHSDERIKRDMAELKQLGLTDSKTGRGGGCWLTPHGRRIALAFRDRARV